MNQFVTGGCLQKGCSCNSPEKLSLDDYQVGALTTNVTPDKGWEYHILGVIGELAEASKKFQRDDAELLTPERQEAVVKELGDVLWYVALTAHELDVSMEEVALTNLEKLAKRAAENKLRGSGDDR